MPLEGAEMASALQIYGNNMTFELWGLVTLLGVGEGTVVQ